MVARAVIEEDEFFFMADVCSMVLAYLPFPRESRVIIHNSWVGQETDVSPHLILMSDVIRQKPQAILQPRKE